MNVEDFDDDVDQHIQDALKKLSLESADIYRRISAADIVYLLNQWPFLQITDARLQMEQMKPLQILPAKSQWKIHDYGDALSSSPGELVFGRSEEDKEGGGSGVGTLVNQAVVTAFEMVDIALKRGWNGIKLVDGHPLMAWAAWMQCLDSGIELEGFQPSAHDFARLKRIKAQPPSETLTFKPFR